MCAMYAFIMAVRMPILQVSWVVDFFFLGKSLHHPDISSPGYFGFGSLKLAFTKDKIPVKRTISAQEHNEAAANNLKGRINL